MGRIVNNFLDDLAGWLPAAKGNEPLLRPPALPAMVAAPKLNVGRPLYVEARANALSP